MPATGQEFGVQNPRDPEDNVRGAVKFLGWLTDYWSKRIEDNHTTPAQGHVEDEQRLAEKYGSNSKAWDDVAHWLLQESKA